MTFSSSPPRWLPLGGEYEPNQADSFGTTVLSAEKRTRTRALSVARCAAYVAFARVGTSLLIEARKEEEFR